MAESVAAFAARVKSKYPDYANVPDDELARRVVAKYPEYASQVDLGPSVADQARASMDRRATGGDLPPGYENLDNRSYGGAVKEALIPTLEGAKHLARTAAAPFAPTPENLQAFGETAMNAGMAQGHQAREAFDTSRSGFDALRRGDIWGARDKYVEAGGHVAAAVLPLVGPAAAEAGEDFKKGDIARFLGKSTALVGSMLVPAAVAKGLRGAKPPTSAAVSAEIEPSGLSAVRRIIDDDGFDHYGFRVLTRESAGDVVPNLKAGDIAPPSRRWSDNIVTSEMENGASAVDARHADAMDLLGQYGNPDDPAVLLGSNKGRYHGVDPGEIVMREPEVLWSGKRSDLTGKAAFVPGGGGRLVRPQPSQVAQAKPTFGQRVATRVERSASQTLSGPSTSLMENLDRIAAASPNAPTLTGIIKAQGPKIAKGLAVAAAGHAIPGGSMMIEALGGGGAGAAALKALYDLPKTAAFKAASVTMKTQFAKALTMGQIADAVTIGGRIVTGETAENMQPGEPAASPPAGPITARRDSGQRTEWPANPGERDENYEQLMHGQQGRFPIMPSALLPDRFANAKKVAWGSAISGNAVPPELEQPNFKADAVYGLSGDTSTKRWPYDRNLTWQDNDIILSAATPEEHSRLTKNQITLGRGGNEQPETWTHELGHAMWEKDMTDAERSDFLRLRDGIVAQMRNDFRASGVQQGAPNEAQVVASVFAKYPRAVSFYLGDKQLGLEETFSELNGQYMANPSAFKSTYPQVYGWFRQLHGKEYIQQHSR